MEWRLHRCRGNCWSTTTITTQRVSPCCRMTVSKENGVTSSAFSPRQNVNVFSGSMAKSGLPSYTEKHDRAVIPLSPHRGRPAPQTRCHPHPPLSGRTDGCPSQSPPRTPGSQPGSAHDLTDGKNRSGDHPQHTHPPSPSTPIWMFSFGGLVRFHSLFWQPGSKPWMMSSLRFRRLWLAGAPSNSWTDAFHN